MTGDLDVRCHVSLPAGISWAGSRTLTLTIEDVTLQDVPAATVARVQIAIDGGSAATGRLGPFALHSAAVDFLRTYNLRAEMDLDSDGRTGTGDLVSTQHCAIAAKTGAQEITVPLQRI
jgi:hypothetical protein